MSMIMSDGVLTPAQSVLGAVQGLNVVKPDITKATVIGTTCGILICLFLIQPLGTTKIATTFAPIVITWLAFNASFGIYNLTKFDHSVLKAFSPSFAFKFLIRRKTEGWKMLGGVLLAFTGVEALFADLGAFSRRAIQLSWLCYAFPCLLLAYIGQAAYISVHPGAYTNPFFNAVPPGALYPSLIIAILAAIVASQAIITATFQVGHNCVSYSHNCANISQLMAQIMKLSYFPQIKVVHTSKIFHGQLYVPIVNWLLMIGTVLAAAIYNNVSTLGNRYVSVHTADYFSRRPHLEMPMGMLCPILACEIANIKSQQSLRHVRHFLRHVHGVSRGFDCVAYPPIFCLLPLAHDRMSRWTVLVFRPREGSSGCLVHSNTIRCACLPLHFMEIWKGAAMGGRSLRPFPDVSSCSNNKKRRPQAHT